MSKLLPLLLLLCSCVGAPDHWIITTRSYHQDREPGYNEFNPGLGGEWGSWGAGAYVNSYDDLAPYVTYAHTWGRWGVIGGAARYSDGIMPLGGLTLQLGPFRLLAAPPAGNGFLLVLQITL